MPYRNPSGFVIVVCPDWAYHAHWLETLNDAGKTPLETHVSALVEKVLGTRGIDAGYLTQWAHEAKELLQIMEGDSPTSRIGMLIKQVLEDPRNEKKLLPHIIRTEAPAFMVGHDTERYSFVGQNRTVLKGAHTVYIDGHSDCAGIAHRCVGQFHADQRDLQAGFFHDGAQDFANLLTVNARHEVTVIAEYPRFDSHGEVLDVTHILTVKASAPATHS